jgi:hypothetical protein
MRETAVESHPFRKVREKGWGTQLLTDCRCGCAEVRALAKNSKR